jgi:hypothetical protein
MSDHRRSLDWSLDLLATYTLTTRYHRALTETSVLSLLQSPLTVSWQRILTQEIKVN